MTRFEKKVLAIFAVFAMIIAALPILHINVAAEAWYEERNNGTWAYTYNTNPSESYIEIDKYLLDEDSVTIPSTIENTEVAWMNEKVFDGKKVQSISIPSSLTVFDASAFVGAGNLQSFVVYNGLSNNSGITISASDGILHSKYYNNHLRYEIVACPKAKRVGAFTIPDSVTTIGYMAFFDNDYLTSITFPKNGIIMSECCFANCDSLTNVTVPKNVSNIPTFAFAGCSKLTTVTVLNRECDFDSYFDDIDLYHGVFSGEKKGIKYTRNPNLILRGYLGSTTEKYATEKGIKFEAIGGASGGSQNMYRLYNPNSGEHFYTARAEEKDALAAAGWRYEGIGWVAPASSNTPVYRLYNGSNTAGDHHYTMDKGERDGLVRLGWKDEGIGWYSDDAKKVPLYREYNPNARTGTHNYTTGRGEHEALIAAGWRDENIGWYAIR